MIDNFKAPREQITSAATLESLLGGTTCVTVDRYSSAIQMCLEVLGTRSPDHVIPVIMPVSAPPFTAAAALHANAALVLMDIDESTLQMNPEELDGMLTELENGAIVVFTRPAGMPVCPKLLDVVKDRCPVVVDTRLIPRTPLAGDDLMGDFLIWDLDASGGAAVVHRYAEQLTQMREWRSGLLGHCANLHPSQVNDALAILNKQSLRIPVTQELMRRYQAALKDKVKILFEDSPHKPYLVAEVANASIAIAHLQMMDAEVYRAVTPLHTLTAIRERFAEDDKPEYVRAEALSKTLITLPMQPHLLQNDKVERLCEYLCEVA